MAGPDAKLNNARIPKLVDSKTLAANIVSPRTKTACRYRTVDGRAPL